MIIYFCCVVKLCSDLTVLICNCQVELHSVVQERRIFSVSGEVIVKLVVGDRQPTCYQLAGVHYKDGHFLTPSSQTLNSYIHF